MAAVAWLSKAPDWEPLITTLGLFGALIGFEISDFKASKQLCEFDKKLYEEFIKELPSTSNGILFLKDHDIGGPFRAEYLNDLYQFRRKWGNASHEFKDKKLNNLLTEFYEGLDKFLNELSVNVFSACTEGFLTIDFDDFERRNEKIILREQLNNMSSKVYEAYQEFIRAAKSK